ncbi:HalOD1 output domain-containing protein [Halomarina salina]|uniref:HalOD1 output domain-containing protein n=1 Tax=Halomarina salina TaxID=1872699 RepID=A0ABD5RMB6_9EURY|nr:HalOD1 output domain-containing protein [Halomarina salina]
MTDATDDWTQVVQHHYDPTGDGELTTAILFAVADARNVSPNEIDTPPLYEWIDAAALEETFFGTEVEDARRGIGTVEFRYVEFLVKVRSDGWIQVFEAGGGTSPP